MGPSSVYFSSGEAATGKTTLMKGTFEVFVDESERLSDRSIYAYMHAELGAARVSCYFQLQNKMRA